MSDNEIYLLIKYIKSVLWRVAKRLSYIEDAQYLKVNGRTLCGVTFCCSYTHLTTLLTQIFELPRCSKYKLGDNFTSRNLCGL